MEPENGNVIEFVVDILPFKVGYVCSLHCQQHRLSCLRMMRNEV